jgi:hypothetical protein
MKDQYITETLCVTSAHWKLGEEQRVYRSKSLFGLTRHIKNVDGVVELDCWKNFSQRLGLGLEEIVFVKLVFI